MPANYSCCLHTCIINVAFVIYICVCVCCLFYRRYLLWCIAVEIGFVCGYLYYCRCYANAVVVACIWSLLMRITPFPFKLYAFCLFGHIRDREICWLLKFVLFFFFFFFGKYTVSIRLLLRYFPFDAVCSFFNWIHLQSFAKLSKAIQYHTQTMID